MPPEQEPSFDEKISLARTLYEAVEEINAFIERQGGFDTFAEAGQYVDGMRAAYDKLEDERGRAREKFDTAVTDKKEFIKKLREAGENDLAERIRSMFHVEEEGEGLFSRLFRKK